MPGEGSRKLYLYSNTKLFRCWTGCGDTFDVFELTMKVFKIQQGREIDLNDAVRFIAAKFGIAGDYEEELELPADWKIFDGYARVQEIEEKDYSVQLKEYDPVILERMNYRCVLSPWREEGISEEAMGVAKIGYYPGADMITIPHFDQEGRLIGIRGRALANDDAERFGKYRPLKVNRQWFNHPLGFNLYGLNNSKNNIAIVKKAIVFESEKSHLLYSSYFGLDNNISVACCGSNLSSYQVQLLLEAGAEEIVIGFDRQFKACGDDEHKRLVNNLLKIREKYRQDALISFIFDKEMITSYKASPIDEGPEKFLKLFKERIIL
jgi:hypothetical protein